MSGLPYYKRYPRDALSGMQALTLEQRGAYNTVLDLIYDEGGPIADHERLLCAHLNCDPRVWRRLRGQLLELGKIYLTDEGRISNNRSVQELTSTEHTSNVRATSGAAGGRASAKSRAKPQQKQHRLEANASALAVAISEPEPDYSEDKSSDGKASDDFNALGWREGVHLLVGGGMSEKSARSTFGRILSANGLEARDMVATIAAAKVNRTQDPVAYLTGAAKLKAGGRKQEQRRVGFV